MTNSEWMTVDYAEMIGPLAGKRGAFTEYFQISSFLLEEIRVE